MEGLSNKTVQDDKLCDQRNLLDFNDITMDDHGRVYVAYTDGCYTTCIHDRNYWSKDGVNKVTDDRDMVLRLSAGKGLIAKYDGTLGKVPAHSTGVTTSAMFALPLATAAVVGRRRRRG